MLSDLAIKAAELEDGGTFLGGPRRVFARVGGNQLIVLLDNGLTPDCKVLDVGCGCLRGGYWLIHFLDAGGYHGIEPNRAMREAGTRALLTEQALSAKRPRFDANAEFEFGVFETPFDFVVARSVWTHAAPDQIRKMLDQFNRHGAPGAAFLTSYLEAGDGEQYDGTEWVGKSHVSSSGGFVRFRFAWIEEMCRERGLKAETLYVENGQIWIRVTRLGERRAEAGSGWSGSRIAGFTAKDDEKP